MLLLLCCVYFSHSFFDCQSGVPLVYTIFDGNTNDVFRMQNCSGILFVDKFPGLDFEALKFYNVTVTVMGDLAVNVYAEISVSGECFNRPTATR